MICNKCKEEKRLDEFYVSKGVVSKPCKVCRRKKALERVENIGREEINRRNRILAKKRYIRKGRAYMKYPQWARRLKAREKKGSPIDTRYIMEMYARQKGKCYFTGLIMEIDDVLTTPVVERIEYDYGVMKNNVVLCCESIKVARKGTDLRVFRKHLKTIASKFTMVKKIL